MLQFHYGHVITVEFSEFFNSLGGTPTLNPTFTPHLTGVRGWRWISAFGLAGSWLWSLNSTGWRSRERVGREYRVSVSSIGRFAPGWLYWKRSSLELSTLWVACTIRFSQYQNVCPQLCNSIQRYIHIHGSSTKARSAKIFLCWCFSFRQNLGVYLNGYDWYARFVTLLCGLTWISIHQLDLISYSVIVSLHWTK